MKHLYANQASKAAPTMDRTTAAAILPSATISVDVTAPVFKSARALDGCWVGALVTDGADIGEAVGETEGGAVGDIVGEAVGTAVGTTLGARVGAFDGFRGKITTEEKVGGKSPLYDGL